MIYIYFFYSIIRNLLVEKSGVPNLVKMVTTNEIKHRTVCGRKVSTTPCIIMRDSKYRIKSQI